MSNDPTRPVSAGAALRSAAFQTPRPSQSAVADIRRRKRELHYLVAAVIPRAHASDLHVLLEDEPSPTPLRADVELLEALREEGLDGFVWSELSHRLVSYGFSVLQAWLISGEIYDRSTRKGRPVKPPSRPFDQDERTIVAMDTVEEGTRLFRQKGIVDGDWDPSKGARLSTYFIGSCVLCFANVCRRQATARKRTELDIFSSADEFESLGTSPSAERTALGQLELREVLRNGVPGDVVSLVTMYHVYGYKPAEIADLVSTELVTYSAAKIRKILRDARTTRDD
ncbi:hypothetical protein ACFXPA_05675 [Amycolatopsis sp. NPDC059090]|uniref:hypothetical protein n=1 Tax=unclassified Amycolatopsis TaxID=2618356 RepID=UPI0036712B29